MRRGQEQELNAAAGQQIPGKGLLLERADSGGARQLGVNFGQRNAAARSIRSVYSSGKDRRDAFKWRKCSTTDGPTRRPRTR